MSRKIIYIGFILSLVSSGLVFADLHSGIGGVASNLMEPVSVLTDFITSASLIIGTTFLFASLIKYMEYRVNPLAVPISNVIFLLICGVLLLCLPIAYKLVYTSPPTSVVDTKS